MKAFRIFLLCVVLAALPLALLGASCGDDDDDDSGWDDDVTDDDIGDDDVADDDVGDDDVTDDDVTDDDVTDDDVTDDDVTDDDVTDDDTAEDATIYDIQDGTIETGAFVTVTDVVATTGLVTAGTGFFVQERETGGKAYEHEYAGVYVHLDFVGSRAFTVARGDVLTITGEVKEFDQMTEIKVYGEDDITVTETGQGLPPYFQTLTVILGGWAGYDPEPYEGVLVRVVDVKVEKDAGSGVYWINQTIKLDDGQVRVDDWFYDIDASVGDEYDQISGPLYQGNDSGDHVNYRIQPRDAADADQAGADDDVVDDDVVDDDMVDDDTTVEYELFFSEYVEGSSYNKALEIYNIGGGAVDLANCAVRRYSNGSPTPSATIDLSGSLAADEVYILCHTSADATILALCDLATGALNFNGDDGLDLVCNGVTLDIFGRYEEDPGDYWGTEPNTTINHTLVRKPSITQGDINGTDPFDPVVEWNFFNEDTFGFLGDHSVSTE